MPTIHLQRPATGSLRIRESEVLGRYLKFLRSSGPVRPPLTNRRKKILLSANYSSPTVLAWYDWQTPRNENNIFHKFYYLSSVESQAALGTGKQRRTTLPHKQNLLTKFQLQDQKPTCLSIAAITLNLMIIELNRCVNQGRIWPAKSLLLVMLFTA